MTANVFCEQCGATVRKDEQFCTSCGAKQSSVSTDEVEVVSEPELTASRAVPTEEETVVSPVAASGTTADAAAASAEPPPFSGSTSQGAASFAATGVQFDMSSWPVVGDLPVELWLVIAAFAAPGAWVVVKILTVLPSAFKDMGGNYFGFRFGLALLLIIILVGLVGVAMLAIAWRLYNRDRVGRGLAYAFAGTLVVSIAFANDQTQAETWAMILSIVGIAILALAPRVRAIFDQEASPEGAPTSVVVSRTLIAIFAAFAVLVGVTYLLLGTVSGKYVVAGIIAIFLAIGASRLSKRLTSGDRQARLYVSVGGAGYVVLLLILGRASAGLLIPIGLGVAAVLCLWIPNDARTFFGDEPLNLPMP